VVGHATPVARPLRYFSFVPAGKVRSGTLALRFLCNVPLQSGWLLIGADWRSSKLLKRRSNCTKTMISTFHCSQGDSVLIAAESGWWSRLYKLLKPLLKVAYTENLRPLQLVVMFLVLQKPVFHAGGRLFNNKETLSNCEVNALLEYFKMYWLFY